MIIGTDKDGKIWLAIDGGDIAHMPSDLNGVPLTALELTDEQTLAYEGLPGNRADAFFDGKAFTCSMQPPAPVAAKKLSTEQLTSLLLAKGVLTQADVSAAPASSQAASPMQAEQ